MVLREYSLTLETWPTLGFHNFRSPTYKGKWQQSTHPQPQLLRCTFIEWVIFWVTRTALNLLEWVLSTISKLGKLVALQVYRGPGVTSPWSLTADLTLRELYTRWCSLHLSVLATRQGAFGWRFGKDPVCGQPGDHHPYGEYYRLHQHLLRAPNTAQWGCTGDVACGLCPHCVPPLHRWHWHCQSTYPRVRVPCTSGYGSRWGNWDSEDKVMGHRKGLPASLWLMVSVQSCGVYLVACLKGSDGNGPKVLGLRQVSISTPSFVPSHTRGISWTLTMPDTTWTAGVRLIELLPWQKAVGKRLPLMTSLRHNSGCLYLYADLLHQMDGARRPALAWHWETSCPCYSEKLNCNGVCEHHTYFLLSFSWGEKLLHRSPRGGKV